jgi:hypothetical protein
LYFSKYTLLEEVTQIKMTIPPEITALVDQLNQELNQTEQEAREGLNLVRQAMSRFPNNALLIQFFAYFSAALFFVDNSKRRIQTTIEQISAENVPSLVIQEVGRDLATLLGETLKAKIRGRNIITRLENIL